MKSMIPQAVFWISVSAIAYNYVGYPVLLFLLSALAQAKSDLRFLLGSRARRRPHVERDLPSVAVLLSVFNEELMILTKVKNCLNLDYPADRLEFLIGLDAPTDDTALVLSGVPSQQVRVIHFPSRRGKLAVLGTLAEETSAEIIITTDANTMLNRDCIRTLVRHFREPEVGAVSGEETRITSPGADPAAESFYWRYESALKFLENRLNCSLGGNGSVLAVRRDLFRLRKPSIVEDFQIPLDIRFQGYRVVYDPEAIAIEEIAPTISSQFVRRIRLGAGDFQTLFCNLSCLDPRNGMPAFCFFSRKVLRWLTPIFLILAFVCSGLAVRSAMFAVLFAAQCLFYLAAFAGYENKKHKRKSSPLIALPFHFCSMNLALFLGLIQYLSGRQSLAWKVTPRAVEQESI